MNDVEKYKSFEDLKKSEDSDSHVYENNQEEVQEFIQLLKKNSRQIEKPES